MDETDVRLWNFVRSMGGVLLIWRLVEKAYIELDDEGKFN